MVSCGRNFVLLPPHPFTSCTTAVSWRSQNVMGHDWDTLVSLGLSHTLGPYGSLHVRKNLPSTAGTVLVACWRQPVGACTDRADDAAVCTRLGRLVEISPSLLSPAPHWLPPPLGSFLVPSLLVLCFSSGPMCMQATRKLWGLLLKWLTNVFYQEWL